MLIWPFLFLGCVIAAIFNPRIAVVFAIHLAAMQGIKWLGLPQHQVLFFACYSVMALISALWFDKLGGVVLALIAMVYLGFIIGFVPSQAKHWIAELGFAAVLFIGAINGPHNGLLVGNPDHGGNGRVVDWIALQARMALRKTGTN